MAKEGYCVKKIIQGSNPLWEANAFQSLFEGAQQALGIRKKKPSRAARDLTRHLLAPRRQDRLCASTALQHQWFLQNVLADDGVDNLPLLDIKDFHEVFSRMERDVGWALDALSKVQISAAIDASNRSLPRSNSCVVCYNHADQFGRTCPRCRHIVCGHCIPRLPKACCPYCRYEGVFDDAVQNSARYSHVGSYSMRKNSCPDEPKRMHGLGEREAFPNSARYNNSRHSPRRNSCPDDAKLMHGLGDWEPSQNSARYSNNRWSPRRNSCPDDAKRMHGLGEYHVYRQSPRAPDPQVSHHRRPNTCFLCNADSSMFDHVCPCCRVSTCASCICNRLHADDLRCPSCGDASSNTQSMSHIAAWNNLFGGVIKSLSGKLAQ